MQYSETDRALAVANLENAIRSASDAHLEEGCEWYPHGRAFARSRVGREIAALRRDYPGLTRRMYAAVVAICNMNNTWAGSLTQSRAILAAWQREDGCAPAAGLPVSTNRAWAILHGAPLTRANIAGRGDKTWNFYRNLCGEVDAVTCDRWACRAAGLPDATHQSASGYAFLADCYRDAAAATGIDPCDAQAVAWVAIRGRAH